MFWSSLAERSVERSCFSLKKKQVDFTGSQVFYDVQEGKSQLAWIKLDVFYLFVAQKKSHRFSAAELQFLRWSCVGIIWRWDAFNGHPFWLRKENLPPVIIHIHQNRFIFPLVFPNQNWESQWLNRDAAPPSSPTQQPHLVTVPVHMAPHIYHQALAAAYTWPW